MVSQHSPTKAMGAIPGFLAPSSWTFWVEAIEPSDTIADVAFTLTPDNVPANSPLIETVRVTTVVVDLGTDSNNDGVNDLPAGTLVTSQYPNFIVSGDSSYPNMVIPSTDGSTAHSIGASTGSYLDPSRGNAYDHLLYVDFLVPVNNLKFTQMRNDASLGTVIGY